jgi:tetratricopeptide (TPR) repeat protein
LAETLAGLGELQEAVAVCGKAIALASQRPDDPQRRADASLAYQLMARLLTDLGKDPLPAIEEGLAVAPDDRALWFLRARALIDVSRCEEALATLERLTAESPDVFHDRYMAYDKRIFREFAYDLIGVARLRLEQFEQAAVAFKKAAAAAPDNLAYRAKAAAMLGRAARLARV